MKSKDLPAGRVLPPKWKYMVRASFYRKFTWLERLRILIGYGAVIHCRIATEHSTGKFHPQMELVTTGEPMPEMPNTTPTSAL